MREERFTLGEIYTFADNFNALVWCAMRLIIKNSILCNICNISKNLIKRNSFSDGYIWKCHGCGQRTSVIRDGSFSKSLLPLKKMIIIIYGFANDFPQTQIKIESGVGSPTIVDWCNFCREVCTRYLQEHPVEIGGFDENGEPITVEIDESYFSPRKYNRGAYRPGRWIFGAVERNSGKLFVITVAAKSEEILLPIISRMILPGSIIVSDGWRAYANIGRLEGGVYEHRVVIHQQNFVDPDDASVHTQTIESV
ncbi:uncharacterized protein LOC126881127 [Diabrotica virgifera virgifera]|uniref:ISXO2-like transposase domain-containing protein n=1 Tax=Diabrotica virgifera virgifera TaxID=50390 RepID=A0ABM5JT84_DIAVI|nr:uncharacterized protein LOC126881127 [Diabrotica virgifera virgifera]